MSDAPERLRKVEPNVRVALSAVTLLVALTSPVFGQSAPTSTFEIADVHGSAPRMSPNPAMSGGAIRDGIYELRNATMVELIRTAYSVESDKVLGGPSWLEVDKFDVVARAPGSATVETVRLMLRGLLADRFTLVVREDKREMTTWVLSQASGGPARLLRARSGGIAPSCQPQPEPPNVKGVCRNMTVSRFAEMLPRIGVGYLTGTVTDATGLIGAWDFDIVFTNNRARLSDAGAQGISLFDALEKQLGLTLEQKTITTTGFLVDSVSRTPSANVPGVETLLPPRPAPEFEVATIKPAAPGDTRSRAQILPNGMLNVSRPLRELINVAWGLSNSELVAGPKWMENARFEVVGRAFAGADAQFVDDEFLRLALRKLLVDRFQITFHYEERPVNAYALVAGTVKMTRADPSSRTRCYEGLPPGAADPRTANPTRPGLVTCQNVTMKYFAERLRAIAGGYIQVPVAEMTGLEGGWDFTLNWSPISMFPGAGGGQTAAAADAGPTSPGAASTPNGAITLPEAVESQLGLKLQMGKRPVSVLVIDQISEKPIDQ